MRDEGRVKPLEAGGCDGPSPESVWRALTRPGSDHAARRREGDARWGSSCQIEPISSTLTNRRSTLKLSRLLSPSLFIGLTACVDASSAISSTDGFDHLPPPTIDLRATSADSGGVLKITVVASNRSSVHLQVSQAPQCPFALRIFPDSTGEFMVATGAMCPSATSTIDLAPSDSVVLSRTLAPSDLTQYAAGLYGINVTVGTTSELITAWGGAVRLPLISRP
jgi:hypothetical protein